MARTSLPAALLLVIAACGDVATNGPGIDGQGSIDAAIGDQADPDAGRPDRPDAAIPELVDAAPKACSTAAECGEVQLGEWTECEYTTECKLTGKRKRAVGTPVCAPNGMCSFTQTIETDPSDFCDRDTEAQTCGTTIEYCGLDLRCRECRNGSCAVNSPHVDAQCNPTCGYAALVCDEVGTCCPTDTCPGGSVGDGPWSDCEGCCLGGC